MKSKKVLSNLESDSENEYESESEEVEDDSEDEWAPTALVCFISIICNE